MKRAGMIGSLLFIVLAAGSIIWYFNTASGQRAVKNVISDTTGGMERVVKVYSEDGQLIEQYEGKIDIQDTEYGNKILFDLDGKRIIIYNATVITEEK
ncbi:hypothetical protein ACFSCZ_19625 [Siminovitchia sediminis]|uniref:Uncharacterized protein n=1 Tax=Siminovitchia sediminis TaxID=1274353 RepID=A0ABW4KNU1_9BACI